MTDAAKKWQAKWGGFVHPHPVLNTQDGKAYYDATPGMTLRDWFAGQALVCIINTCAMDSRKPEEAIETMFARKAYAMADAMLAARQEGGDA